MVKQLSRKFAGLLSLPDSVRIFLSPAFVEVAADRTEQDSSRIQVAGAGETSWMPAVAQLAEWARARRGAARAEIVISNHWVRYAVLPAARGRLSALEQRQLAGALLADRDGAEWEQASIRVAHGLPEEGIVAAGVAGGLPEAILQALAQTRVRCSRISPLLSWHIDRARLHQVPATMLVACVEPRRIVVGLYSRDGWEWMRSSISGDDPARTIERELAREQALIGRDIRLPLYLFEHGARVAAALDPALCVDVQRMH